jgi:membrane protein DedA with SNARE-associated domain
VGDSKQLILYYIPIIISSLPVTFLIIALKSDGNGLFGNIIETIANWIANFGYPAIFAAALLENLIPPIPSELIFPLAGLAAYTNNLGIFAAVGMAIVGALGSTVGALIIYYAALTIGEPAILKIGKRYHLLSESDIVRTKSWFDNHGELAVLLGRMAPGIRELISIPAGIAKMNIIKFTFCTFVGSCIWSLLLTLIGFFIGKAWIEFYDNYSNIFDIIGIMLILVAVGVIVLKYYRIRKKSV